jgi:hypothetical protein
VADVDHFVVRFADFWDAAIANLGSNGVQSLNFGLGLDLVEWVAVGRVANSKTIDGKRTVSGCECSVDIAVVVVVVAYIPIPAYIQPSSM